MKKPSRTVPRRQSVHPRRHGTCLDILIDTQAALRAVASGLKVLEAMRNRAGLWATVYASTGAPGVRTHAESGPSPVGPVRGAPAVPLPTARAFECGPAEPARGTRCGAESGTTRRRSPTTRVRSVDALSRRPSHELDAWRATPLDALDLWGSD